MELEDVTLSLTTGLNPRRYFSLNTEDADNYYITVREMRQGKIVPTQKTDRINREAMELCNQRSHLEMGDVLFSATGTIGETAVLEETPTNWNVKEGVCAIKPRKELLNSYYLRYLLGTEQIRKQYRKKTEGAAVDNIPMKELRKLCIPLPSLEQQTEIVEQCSKLDTLYIRLSESLLAERKARRVQFEYYKDKFFDEEKEETYEKEYKTNRGFCVDVDDGIFTRGSNRERQSCRKQTGVLQ